MRTPFLFLLATGIGGAVGCAFLTANHTRDILTIASCVLVEAATVAPNRLPSPPEAAQIAVKCGAENADAVLDLIRAKRQAAAREALLEGFVND